MPLPFSCHSLFIFITTTIFLYLDMPFSGAYGRRFFVFHFTKLYKLQYYILPFCTADLCIC